MIERFVTRMMLLLLSCGLLLPLGSAVAAPRSAVEKPGQAEGAGKTSTALPAVQPGPDDGRIAWVTAAMLEKLQYLQKPFDASVSSQFLNKYLEALDPQHLHFLQGDLAQFEPYRTNLHHLTMPETKVGDTQPACEIFNRFLQRLQQRVDYVDELLKKEKFAFDSDERILINRKDLPYPKDLKEAKKLWRERLRYEYLQERLGKLGAKKKAETAAQPGAGNQPGTAAAEKKADAKPKSEREEIVQTLSHRYHRTLRLFTDWTHDDVLQIYLTTLARLYDPHSDYMGHEQLEGFAIGMNLSLYGIGAQLRSEDGYCMIERLLPGGPAAKSKKIKEKDRIVAVAQGNQTPVDIVDMNLTKAVQLIRGPKGTEVRLTIIPAGADASSRTVVSLVRDEIPLEDSAAKAKLIELPNSNGKPVRLGVIDLPSFYAPFDPSNTRDKSGPKSTTSADVAKLLKKLEQEKVSGIILDLRRNGGGSLEEAIRLTGLFIKEGPVVQVRNPVGKVEVDSDEDPSVLYEGPLIVLTSRFSASASEIVAGALQDYGRALVVGDSSTHGKGTVQSVNPVTPFMREGYTNDAGAVKITIKKFYRASGASTQKRGVTPDIVLPSIWNEHKDIGEDSLDNPLEWDTIASAKYDGLNLVGPYLPELRKRSAQRVAGDPEFAYVREDIAQVKKVQAEKTVSLNEKERLKEKAEADAREKARTRERLARLEPPEKVYELSLKQAELPGLPSPVQKTNTLAKASGKGAAAPGLSTNMAIVANTPGTALDEDDPNEEKPPALDATLLETEHILVDYLSVFPKQNVLTAGH